MEILGSSSASEWPHINVSTHGMISFDQRNSVWKKKPRRWVLGIDREAFQCDEDCKWRFLTVVTSTDRGDQWWWNKSRRHSTDLREELIVHESSTNECWMFLQDRSNDNTDRTFLSQPVSDYTLSFNGLFAVVDLMIEDDLCIRKNCRDIWSRSLMILSSSSIVWNSSWWSSIGNGGEQTFLGPLRWRYSSEIFKDPIGLRICSIDQFQETDASETIKDCSKRNRIIEWESYSTARSRSEWSIVAPTWSTSTNHSSRPFEHWHVHLEKNNSHLHPHREDIERVKCDQLELHTSELFPRLKGGSYKIK